MTITNRPAWQDITLDKKNSVTFKLIGQTILSTAPVGDFGPQSLEALSIARADVFESADLSGTGFVELVDLSMVRPKNRWTFVDLFKLQLPIEKDKVAGVVFYNASPGFWAALKSWLVLNNPMTPVFLTRTYKQAVLKARQLSKGAEMDPKAQRREVEFGADWSVKLPDFTMQFEVLGPDILHSASFGQLKVEYIEACMEKHAKVIEANNLVHDGSYIYVLDLTHLSGFNHKVRNLYVKSILELHRKYPVRLFIIYGANRFMRGIANISRPFVPFKVRMVSDLAAALNVVANEKSELAPAESGRQETDPARLPVAVQEYADELLEFLGSIPWDKLEDDAVPEIDPDHPFASVFDALALVKSDLVDIFQERQKAEKALLATEDKYRQLIENINDAVFHLDLEGRFTYMSPSIERLTGFAPDIFIGRPYKDFIHPADLAGMEEAFESQKAQ